LLQSNQFYAAHIQVPAEKRIGLMGVRLFTGIGLLFSVLLLAGCQGLVHGVSQLTVNVSGAGTGTVTSTPPGINCPGTCTAQFNGSPQVTLTASPASGFGFGGWTGSCTSTTNTCTVALAGSSVTANFTASLQSINHIIFLAQENRSFDSYFGAMRQYWAQNGYPDQSFDGLAQFNPASGPAPNTGPAPSNPTCDPLTSTPTVCHVNPAGGEGGPPQPVFHFQSMCVENPSPSWNEAHAQWNASDPVSPNPTLDGFIRAAANDARQIVPPFMDVAGTRAMGYFDGNDLNYYYFMASNFATSDRWFSPVMTRTPPNREYLLGATSHGYVYPIGTNPGDQQLIPSPPIFEILDQQQPPITWKLYVNPAGTPCAANPTSQCLYPFTYVKNFAYGQTILHTPSLLQNIVPISQFKTDLQNNTLPQVAQIEPASNSGLDEHPADTDVNPPCCSVQAGAAYVSDLINSLMGSASWQDSVFVLTFDEWGGFYDHVPPQPAVSPDSIIPMDLFTGDVCSSSVGPNCDFVYTGYRVPMIVVSPYTKKNFVSHSVADNTAILKLIETRFNLPSLTARDQAQLDMSTEFLDFTTATWKTPPTPPAQNTSGACYLDHVP
jgi:phospholipase C